MDLSQTTTTTRAPLAVLKITQGWKVFKTFWPICAILLHFYNLWEMRAVHVCFGSFFKTFCLKMQKKIQHFQDDLKTSKLPYLAKWDPLELLSMSWSHPKIDTKDVFPRSTHLFRARNDFKACCQYDSVFNLPK